MKLEEIRVHATPEHALEKMTQSLRVLAINFEVTRYLTEDDFPIIVADGRYLVVETSGRAIARLRSLRKDEVRPGTIVIEAVSPRNRELLVSWFGLAQRLGLLVDVQTGAVRESGERIAVLIINNKYWVLYNQDGEVAPQLR